MSIICQTTGYIESFYKKWSIYVQESVKQYIYNKLSQVMQLASTIQR